LGDVPLFVERREEDWLGKWAMNQMLINVATRKFAQSVRLPEGDVPASSGAGLTKSAVSGRFDGCATKSGVSESTKLL
jgi:putative transposase